MPKKLLAFTAIVEIGTALAVMADPGIVVALLLGENVAGVGVPVARCFGIALLALGLACWPQPQGNGPAFRAMLVYNAAIALFLAYLFAFGHLGGMLLWPAVGLHAVVAVVLVIARRTERRQVAAVR